MSNTFRFEEEVLNTVISNHLENKLNYKRFTEGELRLTIKDKYSPPYQRISTDFFGESKDKSHYFLLELKQQSDPPNIMKALGEALMYRQMIKDEPKKMLKKCKSFDAEKPIHLGLCFPDFNKLRRKNRREFKYRSWTYDTSIFLNKILKFENGALANFNHIVSSLPLNVIIPLIKNVPLEVLEAANKLACTKCVVVNISQNINNKTKGRTIC